MQFHLKNNEQCIKALIEHGISGSIRKLDSQDPAPLRIIIDID